VADVGGEFVVAAAEVLHERLSEGDRGGGPEAFESAHRPQPGIQPAVIGLDAVVGVLLGYVRCGRDQFVQVTGRTSKRAGGVDEQRGEPLHSPVHRDVVDGDAPLDQQLLDVPVGEAVAQVTSGPRR
jgi:hypothetical protein